MTRTAFAALLTLTILALAFLAVASFGSRGAAAQGPVSLAVDANPEGNTATSLGPTDQCIAVQKGATFQVDIVVRNVNDLLGWDSHVIYDPSILKLNDRDVKLFLAADPNSNVFDASDAPPGIAGRYRAAGADFADPPIGHSGSGVLARLTFSALSSGASLLTIARLDISGEGKPDIGPTLTAVDGRYIDDADGDGYFDGPVADAWVAVDSPCPQQPPPLPTIAPFTPVPSTPLPPATATAAPSSTLTPTATPPVANSGSDDGLPWGIVGGASGAAAVLLAAALLLWQVRTRRRA